ncbi:two-component system, cell cycle sensor histidine kinase PleC [Anaerolineae bacterium]|nr:two-component system, cell cycle sensor histidine kinase PleC [Anaerolineae bacterium]
MTNSEPRDSGMDISTLDTVLQISLQMAQTRNLTPLLEYAMAEAAKLVGAERGYLVLLAPNGSLEFRASYSGVSGETHNPADQISNTILQTVVESGKPLVLRDAGIHPNFAHATSVVLLRLRSVMCVPLIVRGQVIGAIFVENRKVEGRFSEKDLPPLLLFANQAAVAIENASLNDELEARITDRTQQLEEAKQRLEGSWAQAVEINRLHTDWLGKIAHDLRAPLSVIIGALNMVQEGEFGPIEGEMREWIERSQDAAQRALTLTNDVLDISQIEMGGLHLELETLDPVRLLQEIYQIARGLSWSKKVNFSLDIPEQLPVLQGDPRRLHQVIMNLLSNARKFTAEGSVVLHAAVHEEGVIIGVRDTGEGISPADQKRIFDRFVQTTEDQEKRRAGTGLGLAICKELVSMHGGHIWVESVLGEGSDFQFLLPNPKNEPED